MRDSWNRRTSEWHVYTFIAGQPIGSLRAKIRSPTDRTSQQNLRQMLTWLNQTMRGRVNYSDRNRDIVPQWGRTAHDD